MKKITGYERCKKNENDEVLDKLEITLYITHKNEEHIKKCLDDKAFLFSLVKLVGKNEPERLRIKVGVVDLQEVK